MGSSSDFQSLWTVKLPGASQLLLARSTGIVLQNGLRRVHLLDANAASCMGRQLGLEAAICAAAVSTRGAVSELVLGDGEGSLHLWDLEQIVELANGPGPSLAAGATAADAAVQHVACSASAIAAASGRDVGVFNLSCKLLVRLPVMQAAVSALAWVGEALLAIAVGKDKISLWHLADGVASAGPTLVLDVLGQISQVSVSPTNEYIAAMTEDLVHIWSLTGEHMHMCGVHMPMRALEGPPDSQPSWIGWHQSGLHILAAFGSELYAWDAHSLHATQPSQAILCAGFDADSFITAAACQPGGGPLLAAVSDTGQVLLFDTTLFAAAAPGAVVYAAAWGRVSAGTSPSAPFLGDAHLGWSDGSTLLVATGAGEVTCLHVAHDRQQPPGGRGTGTGANAGAGVGAGAPQLQGWEAAGCGAAAGYAAGGAAGRAAPGATNGAGCSNGGARGGSCAGGEEGCAGVSQQTTPPEVAMGRLGLQDQGAGASSRLASCDAPALVSGWGTGCGSGEPRSAAPGGSAGAQQGSAATAGSRGPSRGGSLRRNFECEPLAAESSPEGRAGAGAPAGGPAVAAGAPATAAAAAQQAQLQGVQAGGPGWLGGGWGGGDGGIWGAHGSTAAAALQDVAGHTSGSSLPGEASSLLLQQQQVGGDPAAAQAMMAHAMLAAASGNTPVLYPGMQAMPHWPGLALLPPTTPLYPVYPFPIQPQVTAAAAVAQGPNQPLRPTNSAGQPQGQAQCQQGGGPLGSRESLSHLRDRLWGGPSDSLTSSPRESVSLVGRSGTHPGHTFSSSHSSESGAVGGLISHASAGPHFPPTSSNTATRGGALAASNLGSSGGSGRWDVGGVAAQGARHPPLTDAAGLAAAAAAADAAASAQHSLPKGYTPPGTQSTPPGTKPVKKVLEEEVRNVFVGNLAQTVGDSALEAVFGQFGAITHVQIVRDKESKKSKGYAFIQYASPVSAAMAMRHMNGMTLEGPYQGRTIKVLPSFRPAAAAAAPTTGTSTTSGTVLLGAPGASQAQGGAPGRLPTRLSDGLPAEV